MRNSKVVSTWLGNNFKLLLEQCPKSDADAEYMSKIPYVSVVGCLMCVMVCTIPNLEQALS